MTLMLFDPEGRSDTTSHLITSSGESTVPSGAAEKPGTAQAFHFSMT
jgi:hypothetical protein